MENNVITNQERVPLSWVDPVVATQKVYGISTESVEENIGNRAEQVELEQKKIGRPISLPEAYRYILARDGALAYAEKIAEDALNAKNARDRLAAAAEMTDRTSGKAVQSIRHAGVFLVAAPNAEALAQLDSWGESE